MKNVKLMLIIVLLAVSATGCSFAVGGGRLYIFDVLEYVKVTNNSTYVGDVERNGQFFQTLSVGESCLVPFHSGPNVIITFKAFESAPAGRQYVGMSEQTYYPRGQMNDVQSWVVSYVQRPNR